ncbi:uncharacterized protein B0H18DRAFT_1208760 [Fomitopsis serialis]|uniref:uncharacterized protein n=1 Tax=Fomitopsis serialis TaxID=139415 RepID=UPI0020087FD4|nr:uncharacterized protein B0H18DRAFT_1208760 [Neoantrodia serialis]KAH9931968.1 hypothetical protein B0H18DRAFT_1208760 [Neoantrodia serialis]
MDNSISAQRLHKSQDGFLASLGVVAEQPFWVTNGGFSQGSYPDMSTAPAMEHVTGRYETSAFSVWPADATRTQETHMVWTDAPSFGNSSYTSSFDPRSFNHIITPASGASGRQWTPSMGISPIFLQQLGPAQDDAGHQHWMQHGETRFPETPVGDWHPLPGSNSPDRSVKLIHPQGVPAAAQSGGNLGKLQQAPQPIVSASSSTPGASLMPPNDSEAAYVTCKWDGCRTRVDATKDAVKAHLKEAHHADFPAHSRAKDRGAKSGCKWKRCARRSMNNLWRHVLEIHARVATTVRCEKCMATFTRAESLRRHLHSHACRTGADDPDA